MLVTIIVAILLTVLLSLAAPISVAVDLERSERLRATWRIRWLFGLVRVTGARARGTARTSPVSATRPDGASTPSPSRGRASRHRARQTVELFRTPGLIPRVVRFVLDLVRQVSIVHGYAHGTFGLDDPADTGELYGALAPLLVAASVAGLDVRCQPDFQKAGLRGACGARIRVRPLAVAWTCLRFACSVPVLRSTRVIWRH